MSSFKNYMRKLEKKKPPKLKVNQFVEIRDDLHYLYTSDKNYRKTLGQIVEIHDNRFVLKIAKTWGVDDQGIFMQEETLCWKDICSKQGRTQRHGYFVYLQGTDTLLTPD